MARKPVPPDTEKQVLLLVRRRCCICYGLNHDPEIKDGQIAHLDRNSSHNDCDNLAFLCLAHHDQYDSRTSQSKGLTLNEVLHFREELHKLIEEAWRQPTKVGQVEVPGMQVPATEVSATWSIEGYYVRLTTFHWGEMQVKLLPGGRVKILGFASWRGPRVHTPYSKSLVLEAPLLDEGKRVFFDGQLNSGKDNNPYAYQLELIFEAFGRGVVEVVEADRRPEYFGFHVTFEGAYQKVPIERALGTSHLPSE
jgi:hypothetical protein